MSDLVTAVNAYADRFHRAMTPGHAAASPLGAWLVLALTGSAVRTGTAGRLGEVVGMDPGEAYENAAELVQRPHPAVAAAAAMWHRPRVRTTALRAWADSLPTRVEQGDVPVQADADRWARERTGGLIEQFPLEVGPDTALVLASALATKVSWTVPFQVAPATELGSTPWTLQRVLRTPDEGHVPYLARTEAAGPVAVHAAESVEGLRVVSVIADTAIAPADVLAAAHEVAAGRARRLSLFDVPIGDGHSWSLREEPAQVDGGREERCTAVLPAWRARNEHDLTKPGFGFDAAAQVLIALLGDTNEGWEAAQEVMARFTRVGFHAAAVTAIGIFESAFMTTPTPGLRRVAELRFAHPYAVVATATGAGPWNGLPVFSAWVAEPDDADDDETAAGHG